MSGRVSTGIASRKPPGALLCPFGLGRNARDTALRRARSAAFLDDEDGACNLAVLTCGIKLWSGVKPNDPNTSGSGGRKARLERIGRGRRVAAGGTVALVVAVDGLESDGNAEAAGDEVYVSADESVWGTLDVDGSMTCVAIFTNRGCEAYSEPVPVNSVRMVSNVSGSLLTD